MMHGHSKQATLPSSHHAFSSLHSELPFKGAIPCVRTVPRGSASPSRELQRLARRSPGAGAATPLCRQPGRRLPGRAAELPGGGSSTGRCCHLLPAAGTRGPGGARAGRRRPRRSAAPRCARGRDGPARGGARCGHERGRRGSTAAQVSRARRVKARLCE